MNGIVNAPTVEQAIAGARGILAAGRSEATLREWLDFGLREGVLAASRRRAILNALREPAAAAR